MFGKAWGEEKALESLALSQGERGLAVTLVDLGF